MKFRDLRLVDASMLVAGVSLDLGAMLWIIGSPAPIDRRLPVALALAVAGLAAAVVAGVRGFFSQPRSEWPKARICALGAAMGAWVLYAATWPSSWSYPASDPRSRPEVQIAAGLFFGFFGAYLLVVSLVVGLSLVRMRVWPSGSR